MFKRSAANDERGFSKIGFLVLAALLVLVAVVADFSLQALRIKL